MSDRITGERISAALQNYGRALNAVGFEVDPLSLRAGAPYGAVWYVHRRDADGMIAHDLPGFCGSGSSGFTTRRALYDALHLAASTLWDLAYARDKAERAAR